jgi:asparagine synthase (glutamine-hydrolysing)
MTSDDGRWALTFNGEIYNHPALRDELAARGWRFRSQTDTETVLASLIEWGAEALLRIQGMFALAFWDDEERRLLLARDRLGIKPLYYARGKNGFAFASEIKAILGSGVVSPALDRSQLVSYMRLLWVPEPGTLFEGIHKLPPATYLTLQSGREEIVSYWEIPTPDPDPSSLPVAAARLRDALEGAVERQLRADVPVGAFLSGGLDSTALVMMAARNPAREIRTYSIGFSPSDLRRDGAADELRYARLAADAAGTTHQEMILSSDIGGLLRRVVRMLEDPVADPAAINAFLLCEAARPTSTVLLSGTGGDEVFGGYRKYLGTLLGERYRSTPSAARAIFEPAVRALPLRVGGVGLRPVRFLKKLMEHAAKPTLQRFLGYSTYFTPTELGGLIEAPAVPLSDELAGLTALRDAWDARGTDDLVDRMTYLDLKFYLPGLGLAYMDKASMGASVEVRVPLLDETVVESVARLPGAYKIAGMQSKVVFREAVRDLVPREILRRPKAPFFAPVGTWLREGLHSLCAELLDERRVRGRGILRPSGVQRLLREHATGQSDHGLRIWALLTLELWMQEFVDGARQFAPPKRETAGAVLSGS